MSDLTKRKTLPHQTICDDCAFGTVLNNKSNIKLQCTHPAESGVNCSTVTFCNSFQPMHEVDSPCVSFDDE